MIYSLLTSSTELFFFSTVARTPGRSPLPKPPPQKYDNPRQPLIDAEIDVHADVARSWTEYGKRLRSYSRSTSRSSSMVTLSPEKVENPQAIVQVRFQIMNFKLTIISLSDMVQV